MVDFSADLLTSHLDRATDLSNTNQVRGRAYEDALEHVFRSIPGCLVERNSLNRAGSEEIDLSVMNFREGNGLRGLPDLFLVECKNWSKPVGASAVASFATKIRHRNCELGVLVAANGVTGDPHKLTAAHQAAANALQDGFKIILLTTADLYRISSVDDAINVLHERLLRLIATRSLHPPETPTTPTRSSR